MGREEERPWERGCLVYISNRNDDPAGVRWINSDLIGFTCSTPVSMFSYIYVMLFLNFEFAEETSRIDVYSL